MTLTMTIIRPVRLSELHAKAERYRDGFVELFRKHEGAQVLNEDGSEMVDGRGRVRVNPTWFAAEMGIAKQTFADWLDPPDKNTDSVQTHTEGDGENREPAPPCSCIPDPNCPKHGKDTT